MSVSRYGSTLPRARMIEISDSLRAILDEHVKPLAQGVSKPLPLLRSDKMDDDGASAAFSTTFFFEEKLSGRAALKLWPVSLNG